MSEKLTWRDHMQNFAILTNDVLFGLWGMARFLWRINARRGPRVRRGGRWPRTVRADTLASYGVPGGLLAQWEQYGIPAAMLPGSYVRVAGGRKERICAFWVSPDAHWMADRCARHQWVVLSPAVWCPRRGSSAADAQRGMWRASGREPRAASLNESLIRTLGNLIGVRQAYVNIVRNAPGLRRQPKQ